MRMRVAALACLLTAGCVSTNVHRLDDATRPARSPETVAVLLQPPSQPYTVIAVIESKSGSVFDGFDDLRAEMLTEAARLGGDALIVGPEAKHDDFLLTGTAMIRSEERRLRCEVIVYTASG